MRQALLAALRLLTRLPVPAPGGLEAGRQLAASPLFYPLVGGLIGLGLLALSLALQGAPAGLAAALLLVGWVWITGGLHLDGLADTTDAWVGGLGSRERTLTIMKDPAIGAMGALALILVLLVKWAALGSLVDQGLVLALVPALARAQLLVILLTTPYARREGMAAGLAEQLPRVPAMLVVGVTWGVGVFALGLTAGVLALGAGVVFLLWRRAMMARLQGFTGDTAGALVELTEMVLLVLVAFSRGR